MPTWKQEFIETRLTWTSVSVKNRANQAIAADDAPQLEAQEREEAAAGPG